MWDGGFTDEKRDPDYFAQHKFLDTALKLKQLIPDESNSDAPQIQVNIVHIGS